MGTAPVLKHGRHLTKKPSRSVFVNESLRFLQWTAIGFFAFVPLVCIVLGHGLQEYQTFWKEVSHAKAQALLAGFLPYILFQIARAIKWAIGDK